jgi:uncharacterized protein YkwD
MFVYNFFSHVDPVNKKLAKPQDRSAFVGIANPHVAENIATEFGIQYSAGTQVYPLDKDAGIFSYTFNGILIPNHTYLSFASVVVDAWMHSPPHRANILSADGLELGCGTYFYRDKKFNNIPMFMATQNFQWYHKIRSKAL